ncbi:MAG TPA: tyrosine-type recombinase/integrase [Opitutaceae bacterium]|jgi:integrase
MPRVARPIIRRCPWKRDRWIADGLRDDQGKRFRKFFETKEAAKAWLSSHREKSLVEGRAGLSFSDNQRADARRALIELASFQGATLTDAARHYAEFLRRIEKTAPVSELIPSFLAAKKADGRSDRYLSDLRSRLKDFEEAFGDKLAAAITTRDLDEWLRALPLAPQGRANHRKTVKTLFSFAIVQGLARENPATKTARPKIVPKEPGILTPVQLHRLLSVADETLRPVIAISAFAGLRPAEVHRLTWDAVNLEERFIAVSAMTSKTASRRIVAMTENLLAWLVRTPNRNGPVCPVGERQLFLDARKAAAINPWPSNALRHSWVTYRYALTGDAARTASEAGHDQAMLHRHYRALATKSDAEKWFNSLPAENADNAISFEPGIAAG